jgi:hypothetical protein
MCVLALGKKEAGGVQAHDAMLPNPPAASQGGSPARPRCPARCAECQCLPVRPLALTAVGVSLVVLDFRTDAPDLLPDIAGWALIALASWRLGLTAAARLAAIAGAASLAEAWLPFRYDQVDPVTGERLSDRGGAELAYPEQLFYDDLSGWHLAATAIAAVLAGVALWTLLAGLARLAGGGGRGDAARRLLVVAWLVIAVWTAPFLGAVAHAVVNRSGAFDPVWNDGLAYIWLAGLCLFVYLVVLLLRESGQLWALPVGSIQVSPWEARRPGGDGLTSRE